ncbi:hypothetical protein Cgig2_000857 [Carnegiea gigantea]|uniref:Retrotransposon gag domain-containing protein n=1 Tax=Carnegiea gigantea TaxID=171969 RepID=A0A9Q1K004_9CARY|nr:hypothetical protein Cgig2_000857 [Carnegiea gigantea]
MVDALKNFMSTMTDAIMQQVSKQVKKVVEAASSVRPLPRLEYMPTTGCELSHRHDPMVSHCHSERMKEAPYANGDRRIRGKTKTVLLGSTPSIATVQAMKGLRGQLRPRPHMQPTPDEQPGAGSKNPRSIVMEVRDHPMLKRPPLMTSAPKPHNVRKYCKFHEQNWHTIAECWELRKALHELVDKGQIDRFRGSFEKSMNLRGPNHEMKNAPSR